MCIIQLIVRNIDIIYKKKTQINIHYLDASIRDKNLNSLR